MKISNLLTILSVLLLLGACATPQLRRWEGQKLTLCCPANACSQEKWSEKLKVHCPGGAKEIGGETNEKVTGFESETKPAIGYTGTKQQTVVQKYNEECRIFQCSGNVKR